MNETKARELILTLVRYDAHQVTGLKKLCQEWQINPSIEYPQNGSRPYWDIPETIRRLAGHVVEADQSIPWSTDDYSYLMGNQRELFIAINFHDPKALFDLCEKWGVMPDKNDLPATVQYLIAYVQRNP